jgi:hypothetical protein
MQRVFGYSVQTLRFRIPAMTIRANSRIQYAVVIEMHSICASFMEYVQFSGWQDCSVYF